jgi:hypothetical protein
MWLVAGIFPVFLAMILGYMMWVYAWSEFGLPVSIGSLVVPIVAAVSVRRVSTRNLFFAICAATALGLICARLAFLAADLG